jgi:hypothetical protein
MFGENSQVNEMVYTGSKIGPELLKDVSKKGNIDISHLRNKSIPRRGAA